MANDLLDYLQTWYESKCDGQWEHSNGIRIETLDNPGWVVAITGVQEKNERKIFIENRHDDWIHINATHSEFNGYGDIKKLETILNHAKEWLES